MRARRTVVIGLLAASVACGSLLPSGDDEGGESESGAGEPREEGRDLDASFDGPTTVPVDPTVDDPSLADASATGAAGADGASDAAADGQTAASGDGVWSCQTSAKGPFSSLTVCEAARNTYCEAPRADVVDGKPCADIGDRHVTCGACTTKNAFNARNCLCR